MGLCHCGRRSRKVSLVNLALKNESLIVPGYTHMQRAQQHLLLAYAEQLERDALRLLDCCTRINFCPLGACALAGTSLPGTSLPIDKFMTSEALGFTAPMRNSECSGGGSGADFVAGFLVGGAIFGTIDYIFDPLRCKLESWNTTVKYLMDNVPVLLSSKIMKNVLETCFHVYPSKFCRVHYVGDKDS